MPNLTDYLDLGILQQVQDAFTAIAQVPIRIFSPDDRPLTSESDPDVDAETLPCPPVAAGEGDLCSVPVRIDDELLGYIRLLPDADAMEESVAPERRGQVRAGALRFVRLMALMIARLCDREEQLRARVTELATLFSLTGEFTGARDLQGVLNIVARTVTNVFDAKACSIRLLSEDHRELIVKARHGFSEEYIDKGPILLSESRIDREVLDTRKCVYVADERTDPRVLYPAEARREGIVSALCAPLVYREHPEGVVHVYTAEQREFDWFDTSLLQAVAAQAAAAIVGARLHDEAVHAATMKRALDMAGDVQRRMIPAHPPEIRGMDIGAIYVPCFQLGGDFYDFIRLADDNVGVAVCDVVGKGVRASLLMASVRASLRAHASNVYDMSEVLQHVNRDLCTDTLTSDFATMFYGVVDAATRRFTYANAGHPPPLLFRAGEVCHLSTGGGVIGFEPDQTWGYESMVLEPGDVILAYTDGLTEAMNFEDEAFGRERVVQAMGRAFDQGGAARDMVRHVLWEMRRFAGLQTRLDDLTLVVLKAL